MKRKSNKLKFSRKLIILLWIILILGYFGVVYYYYNQSGPPNDINCSIGIISFLMAIFSYSLLITFNVNQDLKKISKRRIPTKFYKKWFLILSLPLIIIILIGIFFWEWFQTKIGQSILMSFFFLYYALFFISIVTIIGFMQQKRLFQKPGKLDIPKSVDFNRKIGIWILILLLFSLTFLVLLFNITKFLPIIALILLLITGIISIISASMLTLWIAKKQVTIYDLSKQYYKLVVEWISFPIIILIITIVISIFYDNIIVITLMFILFIFSLIYCLVGIIYISEKRMKKIIELKKYRRKDPTYQLIIFFTFWFYFYVLFFYGMLYWDYGFLNLFIGLSGIGIGLISFSKILFYKYHIQNPINKIRFYLDLQTPIEKFPIEKLKKNELIIIAICGIFSSILGYYIILIPLLT